MHVYVILTRVDGCVLLTLLRMVFKEAPFPFFDFFVGFGELGILHDMTDEISNLDSEITRPSNIQTFQYSISLQLQVWWLISLFIILPSCADESCRRFSFVYFLVCIGLFRCMYSVQYIFPSMYEEG